MLIAALLFVVVDDNGNDEAKMILKIYQPKTAAPRPLLALTRYIAEVILSAA